MNTFWLCYIFGHRFADYGFAVRCSRCGGGISK